MRVTFAGVLCPSESHVEDTIESADVTQRWQCNVCYAWNKCQPQWLYLSKHDLQIRLGPLLQIRQQDDTKDSFDVGVVVAIDHVHKQIELVVVSSSSDQSPETRLRFRELVLTYPQQFETLGPLAHDTESESSNNTSNDRVSDWHERLSKYGICGTCRRVFHISQGDPQSRIANNEIVHTLRARLGTLQALKQQRIRERKFALVLEATAEIRALEQQIQHARRQLEFLEPLFCPFCGWVEPRRRCLSTAPSRTTAATTTTE